MSGAARKLLAAASQAALAAAEMVDTVRDAEGVPEDNAGSADTVTLLADALRLLLDAAGTIDDDHTQLLGAVTRFMEGPPE